MVSRAQDGGQAHLMLRMRGCAARLMTTRLMMAQATTVQEQNPFPGERVLLGGQADQAEQRPAPREAAREPERPSEVEHEPDRPIEQQPVPDCRAERQRQQQECQHQHQLQRAKQREALERERQRRSSRQ